VVAAASEERRVVTNGMSQYSRNERNANAGIVVGVEPEDYAAYGTGPLAGIALQRHWESQAFLLGGENYAAPAQRVGDFLEDRASTSLGAVIPSYRPGVLPTNLAQALPDYAVTAIREKPFPPLAASFQASTWAMRSSRGSKPAPRRRCACPAASISRVSTPGAFIPAAKAQAMPAESFRQAWTGSNWPKRWPGISPAKSLEPAYVSPVGGRQGGQIPSACDNPEPTHRLVWAI
jgi:hypothetical protein